MFFNLLYIEVVQQEIFLGARSSKKRSLLEVNEHYESECNAKIALLDNFYRKKFFIRVKIS